MTEASIIVREPSANFLVPTEPNVLAQLLADKRSPNTKRAYAKDLRDFFRYLAGVAEPTKVKGVKKKG
jgi:integrase/recombinase XerC